MTPNQFDLSLPLRIVPISPWRSDIEIREHGNNRIVCTCHERDAEQIARSVNAFPALLKACKYLAEATKNTLESHPETSCCGETRRAVKEAFEAIKQAEAPI